MFAGPAEYGWMNWLFAAFEAAFEVAKPDTVTPLTLVASASWLATLNDTWFVPEVLVTVNGVDTLFVYPAGEIVPNTTIGPPGRNGFVLYGLLNIIVAVVPEHFTFVAKVPTLNDMPLVITFEVAPM
jgi:hypothetical protein